MQLPKGALHCRCAGYASYELMASRQVLRLAAENGDVHPSLGLHPWKVADRSDAWLATLRRLLEENPSAGIGEVRLPRLRSPLLDAALFMFFQPVLCDTACICCSSSSVGVPLELGMK